MTIEEIIEHLDSVVDTYEILLGDGINSDILDVDDIEAIKEAISALPENKGEWKRTYLDHVAMGERPSILYCSVCCQCIAYPTNYCPNCGADMRGENETNN